MSSGRILVAQGGGPTAVINQSLAGVVRELVEKFVPFLGSGFVELA